MRFSLDNRSGYDTGDLKRLFARAFRALVPRKHPLQKRSVHVAVVSSPIRSRGCAEVGGQRMVIAIAAPSRYSLRRLARLLEHETAHLCGMDHDQMPEKLLYSLGPTPAWAKGIRLRYRRRAPDQVPLLRSPR